MPPSLMTVLQRRADRLRAWRVAAPVVPVSAEVVRQVEASWRSWLAVVAPGHVIFEPAMYHAQFWDWAWGVGEGTRPFPFVGIWPRGAGKSTCAELACVLWGARQARHYVLYVSSTQERADDHVATIARLLESVEVGRHYPRLAQRALSRYGSALGWRRNRLRTESGLTVDALGLDVASRGVKIDAHRPDAMVLDDVDEHADSDKLVAMHIDTITRALLPAGAPNCAILAVQGLVHPRGVFSHLARVATQPGGEPIPDIDWLTDRVISGPHPAVVGLSYEMAAPRLDGGVRPWVITGGEATWPAGMGIELCQAVMNRDGPTSFLVERQHEVKEAAGGMFSHLGWNHVDHDKLPQLVRTVCWCDPAVSDGAQADANGIAIWGLGANGHLYAIWSWEQRATPLATIRLAISKAMDYRASYVGIETNQGGQTWLSVWREAIQDLRITTPPHVRTETATASMGSKIERASRVLAEYERGQVSHVRGTHDTLERALHRFPVLKPHDLVDAVYWCVSDLRGSRAMVQRIRPFSRISSHGGTEWPSARERRQARMEARHDRGY